MMGRLLPMKGLENITPIGLEVEKAALQTPDPLWLPITWWKVLAIFFYSTLSMNVARSISVTFWLNVWDLKVLVPNSGMSIGKCPKYSNEKKTPRFPSSFHSSSLFNFSLCCRSTFKCVKDCKSDPGCGGPRAGFWDDLYESQSECCHEKVDYDYDHCMSTGLRKLESPGFCVDASGDYYPSFQSPVLPGSTEDSYCHYWCGQNPSVYLVGVSIKRTNDEVFCWCDFSGRIPGEIGASDYDPAAESFPSAGEGPVKSTDGDIEGTCYKNLVSFHF